MIQNDQDIRYAAETLLQSNNHQSPTSDMSHSQSINTIPSLHPDYIISEDLLAGVRVQGRMSNVRRFFCLFVTFDLLFTTLMWLICLVLNGGNIMTALKHEIYNYNIHTSLFDIVMAALCRFVVLLLFYALIYINHWIVIAISTTFTCVFLVSKVFVFEWQQSSQQVFEVFLVLASFVLSWGEAWFLDFRVLPRESNAKRYFITADPERTPLIRNYSHGLPSIYSESTVNFYSPLGSPEGSLHRFGTDAFRKYPPVRLTPAEEENYRSLAARSMQDAWDLLHAKEWKLTKTRGKDHVFIMSGKHKKKIFKLKAELDVPARFLLDELFYKVDDMPKWNPSLRESYKVQVIDEKIDVTYQVSADGASGVVSSRDFVNLRTWDFVEGSYVIASVSTEHRSLPKCDKYTRAENGAGCMVIQEIPNISNRCSFQWVLNTDLKGWIPGYILESAFTGMLFDYVQHLRAHINELKEAGKIAN